MKKRFSRSYVAALSAQLFRIAAAPLCALARQEFNVIDFLQDIWRDLQGDRSGPARPQAAERVLHKFGYFRGRHRPAGPRRHRAEHSLLVGDFVQQPEAAVDAMRVHLPGDAQHR